MISIYKLFEGFTKGGRWIPYSNSAGNLVRKRKLKVLDPKQSQNRYKPFKKLFAPVIEKEQAKFKIGPTPKYFKSGRSNLPSYSKRFR